MLYGRAFAFPHPPQFQVSPNKSKEMPNAHYSLPLTPQFPSGRRQLRPTVNEQTVTEKSVPYRTNASHMGRVLT